MRPKLLKRTILYLSVRFERQILFRRHNHVSPHHVDIPNTPVSEFVLKDFGKFANRIALIDGISGRKVTFSQLQSEVHRCSAALRSVGLRHGDVACLVGSNAVEFAHTFLSVTANGAALTIANPQSTPKELADQIWASGSKYIFTTEDTAAKALQAASLVRDIREIFVFGEEPGCRPFSTLLQSQSDSIPDVTITADDTALIPFSSGTTGLPKGVMLSNRNLVSNLSQIRHPNILPFSTTNDVSVSVLPMVHIAGLIIGMLNPLSQGATVVVLPRFEPETYLKTIQEYKGTFSLLAPPIVNFFAKHPLVDKFDLSSLKNPYSGASTLGKDLTEQMATRLNLDNLRQGYGMSETSPVLTTDPVGQYKYGSIGKPIPNTEIKLVTLDEDMTVIDKSGESGEVWARGPQVMKGYLRNPQATAETITGDGWLKTGDIGYFDDDGHYYIVDRLKDIIKYKGYQISPAYLESILLSHPDVEDAAVVGIPADVVGEVPRAYVIPKGRVTTGDITDYINAQVAPYKRLRGGVEFVSSIPKSPSGKILRRLIRDDTEQKTLKSY